MLYKLYVREQISEMHIQKFMQYNYFRQAFSISGRGEYRNQKFT